ncbi:MAG: hypothetical protein CL775_00960 [Chloroflexi bacterium]|nr:hypothetical protein [Chloroflexota bacterium]
MLCSYCGKEFKLTDYSSIGNIFHIYPLNSLSYKKSKLCPNCSKKKQFLDPLAGVSRIIKFYFSIIVIIVVIWVVFFYF